MEACLTALRCTCTAETWPKQSLAKILRYGVADTMWCTDCSTCSMIATASMTSRSSCWSAQEYLNAKHIWIQHGTCEMVQRWPHFEVSNAADHGYNTESLWTCYFSTQQAWNAKCTHTQTFVRRSYQQTEMPLLLLSRHLRVWQLLKEVPVLSCWVSSTCTPMRCAYQALVLEEMQISLWQL